MFDDRLEILSPGSFMPFVTATNIYTVLSVPRNPILMGALRYLDLVKLAREGTRRMKATMDEMGLPAPEFRSSREVGTHVTVILRNKIKQRKA
jgi:ATP-dependent DNA helicase RecG